MEKIIQFISSEWDVLSEAPVSFALLLAMAFGGSYAFHRSRLKGLKELLSIRDARIEDYQRKTQSSSADEAGEKIEELQRELSEVREKSENPSIKLSEGRI